MKEYERLTDKNRDWFEFTEINDIEIYRRLQELENKIENGTLMEINKPFIKKTKSGLYLICKATVIWVEEFDTKAEAEKKLKELQGE